MSEPECKCTCSGGEGAGCLTVLFLIWMVFYGGCELGQDVKEIRKQLESQKAKPAETGEPTDAK